MEIEPEGQIGFCFRTPVPAVCEPICWQVQYGEMAAAPATLAGDPGTGRRAGGQGWRCNAPAGCKQGCRGAVRSRVPVELRQGRTTNFEPHSTTSVKRRPSLISPVSRCPSLTSTKWATQPER